MARDDLEKQVSSGERKERFLAEINDLSLTN